MGFSNTLMVAALRRLSTNWRQALRLAVLPLLISLMAEYLFWSDIGAGGEGHTGLGGTFFFAIAGVVVFIAVFSLMAIGWHRLVILHEDPSFAGLSSGSGRLVKYALDWILLGLLVTVINMVLLLPLILWNAQDTMPVADALRLSESLVMIVSPYVIAGVVVLRLGLGLVATAVDAPRLTFASSWTVSRRHSKDVLLSAILLGAVALILFLPTEAMLSSRGAAIAYGVNMVLFEGVTSMLNALGTVVLTLIEVAMLTELYGRITGGKTGRGDQA
ncbi:hypothetical protein MUY21_12765 [Aliiroseovarius sp. S2029]|uniref:hypothetical protein n=1 Tax=Aliiroseovarius sp. S2029 TaxID=2936988 RepID=UPI0020BD7442|nr:hypothetical protein [Aliiroseovarius sp. S2029]MCK8484910.1 hypothetical protein [Aliiroseovarius sp. S2029]